jgi:hypothetical protein
MPYSGSIQERLDYSSYIAQSAQSSSEMLLEFGTMWAKSTNPRYTHPVARLASKRIHCQVRRVAKAEPMEWAIGETRDVRRGLWRTLVAGVKL